MRILLIQPPLEDFYTTPIRLYPLGLLYAARVLEEAGAEVEVLDCLAPLKKRKISIPECFSFLPALETIPFFFQGYYRFGIEDREIISRIKAFGPDLIGISSQFTAYYKSVEELARLIKKNFSVPVFIGGNHATVFAREIRERTPEIDFVLEGPAEEGRPGLFNSFGIASRKSRLSQIDWREIQPSHHLLRGENYRIGRKHYLSLIASRGCPYRCDFCSVHRMFGREIQYRDGDSVLSEMRTNRERKKTRLFNFEDDNFSFSRQWFLNFLGAVAAEPALRASELTAMNGLCWNNLDEELLEAMRRAGFRELNLSLVTQSEDLQKAYHRPNLIDSFDKFNRIIKAAQRRSFFITAYVIIGLPGQTYAEIKETIDYLLGLEVLVGPSIFYLSPGSPLYEKMDISPKIKEDWNLYRSSAFAVETAELRRPQLLSLFSYVREKNLAKKRR